MSQLQKVSWRTVGYTALGSVVAIASVVAIVNSDGVRPTSLTSSSATRWLVDQVSKQAVLVDGLAGRVVAKINTDSEASDEVAVQGVGGAFLLSPTQASVRTISTSKLQLGTPQTVALLSEAKVKYRVGDNGLTVVNSVTDEASVVPVDDAPRPFTIPKSDTADIAADGSMWLFTKTLAQHVNVDESVSTVSLSSNANQTTTVGAHSVAYDSNRQVVHWMGGGDVSLFNVVPNASEAVLQEPGDDAPCVWLGVGSTLVCVGPTGVDQTVTIADMNISFSALDKLAIAGPAAVIVRQGNRVQRIDLQNDSMATEATPPDIRPEANLKITASGDLVWLDDQSGDHAWVVQRFAINTIDKKQEAPVLDAQGQIVKAAGLGADSQSSGGGDTSGDQAKTDHTDNNGQNDPPHAEDDSVTARAGNTVIVPVTANDWDPENDAIAVDTVGVEKAAGHGTTDVLNGGSVSYVPEPGYSGSDSFSYTIVDEEGHPDTGMVNVELFAADSANRPPIARDDRVKTRLGHPIVIDVLANDIDPERDVLSIPTFRQNGGEATITDAKGPTGLAALKYDPPAIPGIYNFSYQAADPQGGTSAKATVTVEVTSKDAPNDPPKAVGDAIRLRVGSTGTVDVLANDSDPDGDDLVISLPTTLPAGVRATVVSQRLKVTLEPGAQPRSVINYDLSDGAGHIVTGKVLVVRIGDTAANRPPVANPDAIRVVIGSSVSIPVTANDIDPDNDTIRLLLADQPADGAGTTAVEGNSVRFTPNMPNITEPTPVTFSYRITDGKSEVDGRVTVTVLLEALPRPPFARDDFADTVTDKPVTIDVLANDSDPSGGTPSLSGAAVCANGGTATTTDNQRITFTPPLGAVGTFRCKYRIRNNGGLDAEASIIVTVTSAPPGNHDPVINAAALQTDVPVGKSVTFNASDLATDDDPGDSLVFVSVGKPDHGTTTFSQKSTSFTYVAPAIGSADHTPVVDNFDVTISDENDGNVRGTISIRIIDNSPVATPPNTHDVALVATVDQLTRFDVVSELHDSNLSSTLTLVKAVPDSSTPDAVVETSGNSVLITPKASGVLTVTYTVQNSDGLTNTGKIRVTVADPPPVNPPPQAVADDLIVASGGVNSVDLLANDLGITDPGDKASVTLRSRPPASFGTLDLSNGILTLTAGPGPSGGQAVIRYDLDDGSGQISTATVTLTILACSESAPQASSAQLFTPYMAPIAIDLNQYVVSGNIVPGSVSGAGLTGPTGTYNPPAGMNGSEVVTYTVTNGCHEIDHGVLTIDVNRAPVGGDVTRNLSPGATLTLTVNDLASDDEPLSISAISADHPSWVSLVSSSGAPGSIDANTIVASPTTDVASGQYSFTATVQDPGGLTATSTITLLVTNQPPTAIADAYFTGFSQYTFDPTQNDSDPEGPVTVQFVTPVSGGGALLGIAGNSVTVSLPHGVSTWNYTIVDGGGLTASSTVTITSNNAPTAPDISETAPRPTVDVNLSPVDPDGDAVTVGCNSTADFDVQVDPNPNPSNPAEVNRVKLHVTVLTPGEFTSSFTCTSTDTFGASVHSTVTLTITFVD